jgi:Protein of unknown function (DUF4240)
MAVEFWDLIDQARAGSRACRESAAELERILAKMSALEIEAFARAQDDLMRASYRWDLWGAAFVINGGCSDDGFDYFRGWLMLQGRDVWDAALRDPESLADLSFEGDADCEDVLYAAGRAYEQVTGHSLPPTIEDRPSTPAGTPWEESDLEGRYPRLSQRSSSRVAAPETGPRDEWDWKMELGMTLLARGAFEGAAKAFAAVRQDAPRQLTRAIATNNLAWTDLMIDTPPTTQEALQLASEAIRLIEQDPGKARYIGSVNGTLAFALIKNDQAPSGLALIEEVLANEPAGPRLVALRLCIRAIGLARVGDLAQARSVIRQVRKLDPRCQLLPQAIRAASPAPIAVPHELQALAPWLQRFAISDDVERERVVNGASTQELKALTDAVTAPTLRQINQLLDQTDNAEDAIPYGDLAQAVMEAELELRRREAAP